MCIFHPRVQHFFIYILEMTIKTIIWFTCGGIFGPLYANKYRGYHFLRSKLEPFVCY